VNNNLDLLVEEVDNIVVDYILVGVLVEEDNILVEVVVDNIVDFVVDKTFFFLCLLK
jgi:hypothetical protein